MELYNRRCTLNVNGFQTKGLRVAFSVKKSRTKEPNTLTLSVIGLSADSRAKIESSKGKPIILSAGYEGNEALIFSGDVRFASTTREGSQVITKIEAGDGEAAYGFSPVKISAGKNASVADVIGSVADALGVKRGNLASMTGNLVKATFARGFSSNGQASKVLDDLLGTHGMTYSIQNGQLQIMKGVQPADPGAVLLTKDTGMIGSPEEQTPDKKTKIAVVKVKSYLMPQLKPGGVVEIRAEKVRGQFLINKVSHDGDTHGPTWYTTAEVQQR